MQVMMEPRLDTETEDTHLIETFLLSTKPNQAGWYVDNLDNLQDWVDKDFVIIPEKIFDLDQRQPGHTQHGLTYEEHMAEIKKNSHGKIIKIKGPYEYDDGTDDKYAKAIVELDNSKSASTLLENGSKTWTKFAVSPTVWQEAGTEELITKYRPMGLFLVIRGAYGNQAVVEKMCSGSKLKCGRALNAAILNLKNTDNDEYVGEVINSFISSDPDNNHKMSQVTELKKEVHELPNPIAEQKQVTQPIVKEEIKEEVKIEQPKGITLSQEEFESYKKEREEHKQLVLENKTNKLNSLFKVVDDEEQRNKLVEKYIDKDVNLIIQYHNDIFPHVEKFAKGKDVKVEEDKSKNASVLKEEPKREIEDQSKSASVVPNKVNEVLVISKMFAGEVL